MNKHEFLETVKKQVLYIFDRQDIVYELSEHIDDSARDMMEEGLSYDLALDIAKKWTGRRQDWSMIHAQMAVYFEDRMPD